MIRTIRLGPVALSWWLLICAPVAQADVLRVGVDAWLPFRFLDENGMSGIDHELWQHMAKELGFTLQYQRCPWKRCLRMMEQGKIDAMAGLAWREERTRYITYTRHPYYHCSTQFYLIRGKSRLISKHRDLYSLRVGMVSASAYYYRFDHDSKIDKVLVNQESVLPDLLLQGRIDTFIGTDCQADYELKARGLSSQVDKSIFRPGNTVDLYIGFSAKSPWAKQRQRFNEALLKLQNSNFEETVLERITPNW